MLVKICFVFYFSKYFKENSNKERNKSMWICLFKEKPHL